MIDGKEGGAIDCKRVDLTCRVRVSHLTQDLKGRVLEVSEANRSCI